MCWVEVLMELSEKAIKNQKRLEKVRKNGTWGSDIEIIALCRALNVNVIIFQLEKDPIVFISE